MKRRYPRHPLAATSWGSLHSRHVKELFGLPSEQKWPAAGLPSRIVKGFRVWVLSLAEARGLGAFHRAMVECPRCGRILSLGRLHQHVCPTPSRESVERAECVARNVMFSLFQYMPVGYGSVTVDGKTFPGLAVRNIVECSDLSTLMNTARKLSRQEFSIVHVCRGAVELEDEFPRRIAVVVRGDVFRPTAAAH